jgi:RNA polymerase sigma factor (sigma-70 family)
MFYKTNSPHHFNAFGQSAYDWLLRKALRFLDKRTPNRHQLAAEVANTCLMKLFTMPPRNRWCPEQGPLETWLSTLVRNAARDELRRATRRRTQERRYAEQTCVPEEVEFVRRARRPHYLQHRDTILPEVEGRLRALSPLVREMVDRYYFHHLSFQQIGTLLGINPQTVRRRVKTAIAVLGSHSSPDDDGVN